MLDILVANTQKKSVTTHQQIGSKLTTKKAERKKTKLEYKHQINVMSSVHLSDQQNE